MSGQLASADEISGIVITIGADTSGLKSGFAEAKNIVSSIGKLSATVKLTATVDGAKIVADVAAVQGRIQPIKIPVSIDTTAAMRSISEFRSAAQRLTFALPAPGQTTAGGLGQPSQNWSWGNVAANAGGINQLKQIIGLNGGDGNTGGSQIVSPNSGGQIVLRDTAPFRQSSRGDNVVEGEATDVTGQWYNGMGLGRSGGPQLGPDPSPGASFRSQLNQRITGARGLRMIGGVLAAEAIGHTIEAGYETFRGLTSSTIEGQQKGLDAGQAAIRAIPFGGSLVADAGQFISSAGQFFINGFKGRGWATDAGVAEDTNEKTARQEKHTDLMSARVKDRESHRIVAKDSLEDLTAENAEYGMSAGNRLAIADRKTLSVFDTKNQNYKGIQEDPELRKQMVLKMRREEGAAFASTDYANAQSWQTAGQYQVRADVAGMQIVGNTRGAERTQFRGQQEAAEQGLQSQLDQQNSTGQKDEAKRTEEELKTLRRANIAELAAYDKRSNQEVITSKMLADASVGQARMRINHDANRADLAEFDANTKSKVDLEQSAVEKANIARQRAAERTVMVAQQNEANTTLTNQLETTGKVSGLQASGDDFGAEMTQFKSARMEAIRGASPETLAATQQSFHQQFVALQKSQSRRQEGDTDALQGRIDSGNARAVSNPRLAGTIQTIASMKAELVAAPVRNRPQIIAAQQAELKGLQTEATVSPGYATEWKPQFEAKGSPTATGGGQYMVYDHSGHGRIVSGDDISKDPKKYHGNQIRAVDVGKGGKQVIGKHDLTAGDVTKENKDKGGDETNKILQQIAKYMSQLVKQGGGAVTTN